MFFLFYPSVLYSYDNVQETTAETPETCLHVIIIVQTSQQRVNITRDSCDIDVRRIVYTKKNEL